MQTVETDHHPLAARFRFLRSEDTTLAGLGSIFIGLPILTLAGFYFGTIAGHDNHPEGIHKDLDPTQLAHAVPFAIGGLVIGLLFAAWIWLGYMPAKLRELEHEQGGH